MPEVYEIKKVLEEIIEDEKVGTSKHKKITQQEIKEILREKRKVASKVDAASKVRLGEALVRDGMITDEQLQDALKMQAESEGKIGSILVELGFISEDLLLKHLTKQLNILSQSILNIHVDRSVMGLVPSRIMLKYKVFPLRDDGRSIHLAMENPYDNTAIHEVEFLTGKRVDPVIVPAYQMSLALKYIEERGGSFFSGAEIQADIKGSSKSIESLLLRLVESKGSDLLITAGAPPAMRADTSLSQMDLPSLTADQCATYAKALMTEGQWEDFLREKDSSFAISFDGVEGRFRVNAYRQRNTVSLAIRRISNAIPTFEELGLPEWLKDFALMPQGLILCTSPSGHGKTTTIASIIDVINRNRRANIITFEDPVEYLHKPRVSNINQREIGVDANSFSEGLRRVFRQSPDVIVVGEMHDRETIEIALRAAATGHLVLGTMHAADTTAAVDDMIKRFPIHLLDQVRQQISDTLLLVFAQRLVLKTGNHGVVLACEKLINSSRIKDFIRENRVNELRTQTQEQFDDFSSMDFSLAALLGTGTITRNEALQFAEDPEYFLEMGL